MLGVECYICREALSARLDDEDSPSPGEAVDHHLDHCAACRAWQQRAAALSRTLRVRSVEPTPDLTGSVLQAAAPPRRDQRSRWLRVLLAVTATAQLVLGITQVLGMGHSTHGVHSPGMMTGHLFNESTAWNLAMGLGLLWCAVRTGASAGVLPVLTAFLLVLTGFSMADLINGQVPVTRLLSHGILVLGFVLLLIVHRDRQRGWPRPDTEDPSDGHTVPDEEDSGQPSPHGERKRGRRHLWPTGFRRAA